MHYLDMTIADIHQALLEGQVTPQELFDEAIKRAREDNNNAFEYITEKEGQELIDWNSSFLLKAIKLGKCAILDGIDNARTESA